MDPDPRDDFLETEPQLCPICGAYWECEHKAHQLVINQTNLVMEEAKQALLDLGDAVADAARRLANLFGPQIQALYWELKERKEAEDYDKPDYDPPEYEQIARLSPRAKEPLRLIENRARSPPLLSGTESL